MASENRKIDSNYKATVAGVTNDSSEEIRRLRVNPVTNRLLVENSSLSAKLDSVAVYSWNSSSGTVDYIRADGPTRSLQTIDYAHHEVHAGSSFTCDRIRDIAANGTLSILLKTPDTTKWFHMIYETDVEAEATFRLYESVGTSADGTGVVIYNRDRNSIIDSAGSASWGPSMTSWGTIIRTRHFGSGKSFGGGDRGTDEIILKQNTKYLFEITNDTASANYMNLILDWYEHTNVT